MALTVENKNVILRYNLGDAPTEVPVALDVSDGKWRYVLVERCVFVNFRF